jgi:hypothetical protein
MTGLLCEGGWTYGKVNSAITSKKSDPGSREPCGHLTHRAAPKGRFWGIEWTPYAGNKNEHREERMADINRIEVITIIEGIIIMIFGAGIYLAVPMLITGLLGAVFLIVGVVVVMKGFFKKFRNP